MWIQAIETFQPFDYIVQTFHICSRHFLLSDIKTNGKRKTVISGRIPTIFPDPNGSNETNNVENVRAEENVDSQSLYEQVENDPVEDTIEVDTNVPNLDSRLENETWYYQQNEFDLIDE